MDNIASLAEPPNWVKDFQTHTIHIPRHVFGVQEFVFIQFFVFDLFSMQVKFKNVKEEEKKMCLSRFRCSWRRSHWVRLIAYCHVRGLVGWTTLLLNRLNAYRCSQTTASRCGSVMNGPMLKNVYLIVIYLIAEGEINIKCEARKVFDWRVPTRGNAQCAWKCPTIPLILQ